MRPTPLLLLGYNRPDKMRGLIDALRPLQPPLIVVVVDGPKAHVAGDGERVRAVRDVVAEIDWDADVRTRFRPANIGLRASISDAVTWVVGEFGQVIVLEEDVEPGPCLLPYMEAMLERHRADERIMHISGYDVVPPAQLGDPGAPSRLTRYPESIAWATWDRAWAHYDDTLQWARTARRSQLTRIVGSAWAARKWAQNFRDARAGRISTWAYRWIASMWAQDGWVLSPNANLVSYVGQDDGTHTVTRPAWDELPRYEGPVERLLADVEPRPDPLADAWVSRVVFRGTPFGVALGVAVTAALEWRRRSRARVGVRGAS